MASALASDNMEEIVGRARAGFNAGKTKSKEARRKNLQAVMNLINDHQDAMVEALKKDLNKPSFESMLGEVVLAKGELVYFMNNLDEIINPTDVNDGSLVLIGKKAMIHRDPYGVCLIMGAWNYPIQLVLAPLVGAIAAGNAVVIKPSELSPATADLFEKIIPQYLDRDCYPVVNGGPDVAQSLLKQRFDHILYTGGCNVAKIILRAAAEHLTPVTLELGGKCPAYIDSTADIKSAARRVAWGKFQNAGQTCVAPDYVMCDANLKDRFIQELRDALETFYGTDAKLSPDYGRIVNDRHYDRVYGLLEKSRSKVKFGGAHDKKERYIEPTVLDDVTFGDPSMSDEFPPDDLRVLVLPTVLDDVTFGDSSMYGEIFGPILPVVPVSGADEAIRFINSREKPLALYVFSMDKKVNKRFMTETSSGNITVNDTLVHVGVNVLPFGGVGNSGMGGYHGKFSVDTFSHQKSCLIDPAPSRSEMATGIRYPPYTPTKESISCFLTSKATRAQLRIIRIIKYAIAIAILAYGIKALGIL